MYQAGGLKHAEIILDGNKITNLTAMGQRAAHEISHCFGMDECPDCTYSCSVMASVTSCNSTSSINSLTDCDISVLYTNPRYRKDDDGDGYYDDEWAVSEHEWDCNDSDPNINPGAQELCDGDDQNCNGMDDEMRGGYCPPPAECANWDGQILCVSPIIVELGNGPIELTSNAAGVYFDLNDDGSLEKWSWTKRGDGNTAFLAQDTNQNGVIDSGRELFGNFSKFPRRHSFSNGFEVLRYLDSFAMEGNADGVIDHDDRVWSSLLLWIDVNHNGYSEASELLRACDYIGSWEYQYRISQTRDQWGNVFRWRGKVTLVNYREKFAWDVVLLPNRQR